MSTELNYWNIQVVNSTIHVEAAEGKRLRDELLAGSKTTNSIGHGEFFETVDIFGSETIIRYAAVDAVYEWNSAYRESVREWEKAHVEERDSSPHVDKFEL